MSHNKLGLAPLIGLLLAATLSLTGCDNPFGTASNDGGVVTLTDAGKKALTVNPSDLLPSSAKCSSGDKLDEAAAITGPFKWNDSVSTTFASSDKAAMLKEVTKENCVNPVLLDMNVQALSGITIDGWNVGDHNPWMGQFLAQGKKDGLRTAFLTKKQGQGETIFVTADMQKTAALTNTLIQRFSNVGVVSKQSLTNWHRPGGGLVAGELVRTELNSKQEGLPVLRVELTEKGQGCVFAAGWNVGDKRFETLACQETPAPASTAPTDGNKPSGKPSTPQPSGTTSTPGGGCVEIPGNGKVDCGGAKNPSKDPQRQGNVPTQVRGSNPPAAPKPSKPAVPSPTSTYVPPPPPKATPPPTTPRPTQPSTPATGANTPKPGKSGCVPPPGETTC